MPTLVVKLGSSIVAEATGDLRPGVLERVCDEVAALHGEGVDVVIVTSGAIARGMRLLELPIRPRAIEELAGGQRGRPGQAVPRLRRAAARSQSDLAQVLLTFFDMSARTHYLNARRTLRTLLDWRIVPVINENDTTTTDEISFGDNDFLAAQVAVLTGADLLSCSPTPAASTPPIRAWTRPRRSSTSSTDPEALGVLEIGHATSPLGSGGMRSKVVAAEMATAAGISTVDRVRPRARRHPRRLGRRGDRHALRAAHEQALELQAVAAVREARARHACASTRAPRARCGRAARRCCRSASSRCAGAFDAGDAVDVQERGDGLVGKGICNYSAVELRRVIGRKSAEVRAELPRATEEAVHRDYFVLA